MNWKCSKCEDVRDRQFRRACSFGGQCEYRETLPVHRLAWHWLTCPHRGDAIAKISGTTAGTGCGCENVEVYRCDHFGQPVIKQASPRCLEKIAASVPGYTGRTCRDCKLPTKETETKEQKNQPETRQETSRPLTTGQTASMRFWDAADSFSTREPLGSTRSSETGSITRDTTAATGRGCGNEATTG